MNWFEELCNLYKMNEDVAGDYVAMKDKDGKTVNYYALIPLYHNTLKAQLTVYLTQDGKFITASHVPSSDGYTIIPVTEDSFVRTSAPAPHALCDNLKYVARDYAKYMPKDKRDLTAFYNAYITELEKWESSDFSHPTVEAVYEYLSNNDLVADLLSCGAAVLNENGYLDSKLKIGTVGLPDASVRFHVLSGDWDGDLTSIEDGSRPEEEMCWRDKSLQQKYIDYIRYQERDSKKVLSYATGNMVRPTYNNQKKICSDAGMSKLISFNDVVKKDLMLFTDISRSKEESLQIGYEESYMFYNALKWIIRKQGRRYGGDGEKLTVVCWVTGKEDNIPRLDQNTRQICAAYDHKETNPEPEKAEKPKKKKREVDEEAEDCNTFEPFEEIQYDAERFLNAIDGYEKMYDPDQMMHIMAFSAATSGRLAIVGNYCGGVIPYLENVKKWHRDMSWLYPYSGKTWYYGTLNIREMLYTLYGRDSDKSSLLEIKSSAYNNIESEFSKRLMECILYGQKLPADIVNNVVNRASQPLNYHNWWNWEKILSLACACVRKQAIDNHSKEEWSVSLNRECNDRSYLYGRLLAVADRAEYRTFKHDTVRETNAKRYMSKFKQRPFHIWNIIEERARVYFKKLNKAECIVYENELDEIMSLFKDGDYQATVALNGNYLLGYHNESTYLKSRYKKVETTEVNEEN